MKPVVHFVYLHGDGIGCPQAIPGHLGPLLEARGWRVRAHAWDAFGSVEHRPGDILLGHPHPVPGTAFRASLGAADWGRKVMLCPYNGDPLQVAWLSPLVADCDRYLALCGPYWARRQKGSVDAWWGPKFTPLELGVDRADYPRLHRRFGPAGRRRWLYVGRSEWPKNPAYLRALARSRPDWDWGWIGSGRALRGFRAHGRLDFREPAARGVAGGYDFMLTVGTFDANPSTLLEAMAWGLVPVCTPQSGYQGEAGIVNVPLGDLPGALAVLDALQRAPASRLLRLRAANDRLLRTRFRWDRVADEVDRALRAPRPPGRRMPFPARAAGWWPRLRSPVGPVPAFWRLAKARVKRILTAG